MDFLNIIATLRKFGNFLAGLFPVLAVLGNRVFEFLKLKELNAYIEKQREKPPFSAIAPIIDRFFWKDYAKDRLEIATLAPEMVPILKLVALVSIFLVFLMPLSAVFHSNLVKITLGNGTVSSAPAWAVWCWVFISAFAWACLTAGAAISNRWALTIISLACIYYLGTCALFLPRSYWNVFLSFTVLLGIMISAKVLAMSTVKEKIGAVIASVISGAPTGLVVTALTPVHHYVKPFVLQWAGIIGSTAGRINSLRGCVSDFCSRDVPKEIMIITLSSLIYLVSLVLRGGLSPVGEQLISSIKLWNGYMWPIWYYIGVGIIYKLLKNARIISKSVQDLMPKRSFVPLALVALAAGLLIFWSPVLALAYFPPHPLASVSAAFIPIYKYYRAVLSDPTNIYSSEWMRWILAVDLFVIIWMIAKRKLTNDNVGSLSYFTLLSWFFIAEYTFQISSFSHAPRHSEVLVTLFAVWLMWLFHTSILGICSESSRLWPAQGRQLLYSGFVCLCLLEIAARTSVQDYNVSNEIFLMMFRGIIDVGIPYFLFVFATRKLDQLPISTLRLFQAFCLGAVFTFPMNILDKFSLSGGTMSGLAELWKQETTLYSTIGVISTSIPHLSPQWLILRGILFASALTLLTASLHYVRSKQWFSRSHNSDENTGKTSNPPGTYAALVFLLISFAGGFASFSKTAVDLPLPNDWKVLISPFSMNVYLDYYWLVAYLSAWLSALVFLFIFPQKAAGLQRNLRLLAAVAAAALTNFGILWLFPGQEYELISANVLPLVSMTGIVLLLYLGLLIWNKVQVDLDACIEPKSGSAGDGDAVPADDEQTRAESSDSSQPHPSPLFSRQELSAIAFFVFAVFTFAIGNGLHESRMISNEQHENSGTIVMPAHWTSIKNPANPKDTTNHFAAIGETDLKSYMDTGLLPVNELSLNTTFEKLAEKISKEKLLADFSLKKVETWSNPQAEVVTGYFTYSQLFDGSPIAMTGITALIRKKQTDSIQFVTIYCFPSEFHRRIADLRRIVAHNALSSK
ncbi:MAG: hypothetical protein K2X77_15440 [Candidatus Obscuribacterales bacterium]|jgi:hypothetical protein|nr:hypothetical protein [Candidatus Obscuribacterales bacterium]